MQQLPHGMTNQRSGATYVFPVGIVSPCVPFPALYKVARMTFGSIQILDQSDLEEFFPLDYNAISCFEEEEDISSLEHRANLQFIKFKYHGKRTICIIHVNNVFQITSHNTQLK